MIFLWVSFWLDKTVIVHYIVAEAKAWCEGGHGSHTHDETLYVPHADQ